MPRFYLYRSQDDGAAFQEVSRCIRRFDLGEVVLCADIAELPVDQPACLITRLGSSSVDAHDLLVGIREYGLPLSVICLAELATAAEVVTMMRCGVVDVLQRPFDESRLCASLNLAVKTAEQTFQESLLSAAARQKFEKLNFGERDVLQLILAGISNKRGAPELGVAVRTVESRRCSIFRKLGTFSVAEIVAMLIAACPELKTQPIELKSLNAAVLSFRRAVRKRAKPSNRPAETRLSRRQWDVGLPISKSSVPHSYVAVRLIG